MSFLDTMQMGGNQSPQDQPQSGQMGNTGRTRQRFIDRVLMRQRDRLGQQAMQQQPMAGGGGMSGGGVFPSGPGRM